MLVVDVKFSRHRHSHRRPTRRRLDPCARDQAVLLAQLAGKALGVGVGQTPDRQPIPAVRHPGRDGHVGRVHVKGQSLVGPVGGNGCVEGVSLQVAGAEVRLAIGHIELGAGESAADPHRAAGFGDGRTLDITGVRELGNCVGRDARQ